MSTASSKQKITLALDREVYQGLVAKVGRRKIGEFISKIARPYLHTSSLDAQYAQMALDEARSADVQEWSLAPIDVLLSEEDFSAWKK